PSVIASAFAIFPLLWSTITSENFPPLSVYTESCSLPSSSSNFPEIGVPSLPLAASPWASDTWTPLISLASWACSLGLWAVATVLPIVQATPSASTIILAPNAAILPIDVLLIERSVPTTTTVRSPGMAATEEFLTFASGTRRIPDVSVRKSSVGNGAGALEDGHILADDGEDAASR